MPLFSILVPTFNPGEKLALTLDSIRAQNFPDLEILVQDGGSTDGTREFLLAQNDVNWKSESDEGIYDAMNRAIWRSKGRFLLFLGAGDTLEKGVLERVAALLPPENGLNFVYGNVIWDDGNERIYGGSFGASRLRTQNICHQAIFYERALFETLGLYNLQYPLLADWEFNFRCFGDARVSRRHLEITVARFEVGGRSSACDEAFLRDRLKLIRRHLGMRQWILALGAKGVPSALKAHLKKRA